ncbi:MAG: hypothetical protein WC342_02320 [Methanoregula sp.]|jgi:hypothetical protein
MQNLINYIQTGDIAILLAILGLFIGYCYLFHFLNTSGLLLLSNHSKENKKLGISFFYAFILSLIVTILIIECFFLGEFSLLSPTNIIEITLISYLIGILVCTFLSIILLMNTKKSFTPSILESLNKFMNDEHYSKKYDSMTALIFILILEMAIFGYIFNSNIIIILIIDTLLLTYVWTFGILNNLPANVSTIIALNGERISNVYIFTTEGDYITYLSANHGWVHLNKNAVFQIVDNESQEIESEQNRKFSDRLQDIFPKSNSIYNILNGVMIFFAIIFATIANYAQNILSLKGTIIGTILCLLLFGGILLFILKKYAIRYWD